jgi:teichuronic acid exporter
MNLSLKKGLISGFYWSLIGQVGYMLIALISNVILVRLLSTKEFGQVGIIMFFILLAKVLTESGFSGALVRKKNATHKDFTTVFIFNLIVSLLLFLFFVFISDYVADFYRDPALKNILIVSSFVLIINAFQITHNAKLVKNLEFKKKSIYSFISILIASIVAVILAFNGAGVWSIVAMQLLTAFILTLLLWVYEGSVGKIIFSKTSFKELFKFGIYTTLASVLNTIFENVYQLVLGKYFSINQTGLFYQAKKIQEIPVGIIKSTTLGVVFSSLSKVQEDLNSFNSLYKKIITVFTALVGFICVFVFFYAENIILLLYGEKWIGAIFFIQVLIIASFFYMQEMFNRIIFKVFNQTSKILFLEIINKTIQLISIIVGVIFRDLEILMYGFLFTSIFSYFINYYYTSKVLGYFSWQEIILVLKTLLIGVFTVVLFFLITKWFHINDYVTFFFLPIIILVYFGGLKIFKVTNIILEIRTVLNLLKK